MKKTLIKIVAMTLLTALLTACAQLPGAPAPPVRALPAQPGSRPAPGITVNLIDFEEIAAEDLEDKYYQLLEKNKTAKGYTYWQSGEYYYIAIFAGQMPTAGYDIRVDSVEDNEGRTNILVEITAPSGPAAEVITYPYVVIKATGITDSFNIQDTAGNSFTQSIKPLD